ncbi:GerAB/ArcD/ProY family transporter [Crassaminicella profunda]|uniref:GerAB/ArcD/ProY family transporter n=1 Tax=Crassaminicella profunda TaxID=1286698 RepID=UPI001CA64A38|nr:endospore germination permease [Crassaminicella profunda]QZY54577.1 endospore germination permease [Crassaminicella profunda]
MSNKETISDREGICLVILFISGSSLALPTAGDAGRDLWLAIIIAIIIAIPILLLYSKLLSLYPGKDLFDILVMIFGRFLGKIIGILYIWFSFHLGALVIRDFGEFPITVSIPETPIIAPMLLVVILSIWIVKEGIEVLGRWAKLFLLFNAPLPSILILLLISQMDIGNIQPVLYEGIKPLLKGTFSAFSFPFAETVVFTMILSSLKTKKSPYKIYIKGLLLGGMLIAGVSLAEILVIGPDLYAVTFFPNHSVARKVHIGQMLSRMEVIVILATITAAFLKVSVCLLAVCRGIMKLFRLNNYRFLVAPIGLLMLLLSIIIHKNIIEMFEWNSAVWAYYAFPFQVIIPIMALIMIRIKKIKINQ